MSDEIELPTEPVTVDNNNPRELLIYGAPKIGKTTVCAGLEDNFIIDIEDGSEYVEALKKKALNPSKLKKIISAVKKEGQPYKYTTLDTITELEQWAEKIATRKHKSNNPAFSGDIKELAYGLGYSKIRTEFMNILDAFRKTAEHNIFLAHVKDKVINDQEGSEVQSKDINLTGKLKDIVSSSVDAIGFMRINPENTNQRLLSFQTSDQVTCGNRCSHLEGEEFVISEKQKDGTVKTFWNNIYID